MKNVQAILAGRLYIKSHLTTIRNPVIKISPSKPLDRLIFVMEIPILTNMLFYIPMDDKMVIILLRDGKHRAVISEFQFHQSAILMFPITNANQCLNIKRKYMMSIARKNMKIETFWNTAITIIDIIGRTFINYYLSWQIFQLLSFQYYMKKRRKIVIITTNKWHPHQGLFSTNVSDLARTDLSLLN